MYSILREIEEYIKKRRMPFKSIKINYSYFSKYINYVILENLRRLNSNKAYELYEELSKYFMTTYDESGNIGKRYRREDVIGTPFCITVDDMTINSNKVTIRDRDTMEQITIDVSEIKNYIEEKIRF